MREREKKKKKIFISIRWIRMVLYRHGIGALGMRYACMGIYPCMHASIVVFKDHGGVRVTSSCHQMGWTDDAGSAVECGRLTGCADQRFIQPSSIGTSYLGFVLCCAHKL
jgi:hypothetical protein